MCIDPDPGGFLPTSELRLILTGLTVLLDTTDYMPQGLLRSTPVWNLTHVHITVIQLGNQGRAHTCIGRSCSLPCFACLSPGRHELPVDPSDFTDDEYHGALQTSWPGCTIDGSFGSLWIDANNAISNPSASTAYDPLTSSVHLDFDAYQFATSAGIYAYYPPRSAPTHDPIHSHIDSVASLSTARPHSNLGFTSHACYTITPLTHSATSDPPTSCCTYRLPY